MTKRAYKKWTTESFIEALKEKFPDNSLDFSKVVYTKMADSVEVACMKHGFDLEAKAFDLSEGRTPCPLCGAKKMTTEQFITASKFVHGDRFDYSNTELIKRTQKVSITCFQHGKFEQLPTGHLKGKIGCTDCTGQKRITPDVFVERSKAKHGKNTFDYSHVPSSFTKAIHTKIKLKCNKHDEWFEHTAWSNLQGANGCTQCGKTTPVTLEDVIRRGKEAFPHKKYDYSQVDLSQGITGKVKIGCPVKGHGFFMQRLGNHLYHKKEGCDICDKEQRTATINEFISRSEETHGKGKYTYERTVLTNGLRGKVFITCTIDNHGSFEVDIPYHLRGGSPCPRCKEWGTSLAEKELLEFVEMISSTVVVRDRSIIKPLEIDIYVPEQKVGFEFNGLYWHSETFKNRIFIKTKGRELKKLVFF